MSRFTVPNDKTAEVKRAFQERLHLVDRSPGFVRMVVISPIDKPNEIVLPTFWETENNFKTCIEVINSANRISGYPKGSNWFQRALS